MAFGLAEVNYALMRVYPKAPPMNTASWPHPFYTNCPKDDSWVGEENFKQWTEYSNPQGIGGNFAKAQAAGLASSTLGKAFDVPRRWKNGFAYISGQAILATRDNEGALFRAVKKETDGGIRSFGDRLSVEIVNGDGNGNLGRVVGAPAGNVVTVGAGTVAQRWVATRFKEGMQLNRSTDGTLANIQAETYTVTRVNPKAGTITLNNVTNLVDTNWLAAAGDYETGGCHGVFQWIPLTAPGTSDSFFGVNRDVQPTLLSGHRLDASTASNSVKEQTMDLVAEMSTMGSIDDDGTLDAYLHSFQWNRLQKDLDAQAKRDPGKDGKFGHPYISYMTGGKEVKFFQDNDFPADRLFITARKSWMIRHVDGFPHLNKDDGNPALRAYNSDSIEVRLRSGGNLFNLAPGASGVAPLTASF